MGTLATVPAVVTGKAEFTQHGASDPIQIFSPLSGTEWNCNMNI